jgi:hypothetical protein
MPWNTSRSLSLAAALLAAAAAPGQTIQWNPPGGQMPVGQVYTLQLEFSDCSPDDVPAPPNVDGLTLQYQGKSTNISLINGTFTRNVSVAYVALLKKQQEVDIPSFKVKTNKGALSVPAAHFAPSGATVGSNGIALGTVASARLVPSAQSVWAGEVFDLKYTIDIDSGYSPTWGRGTFDWDPSPLVAEEWSQPEPFTTHDNGTRSGLSYHTHALATGSGHIPLNATSQLVELSVGVTGFGFFQQRQYQELAVADTPAAIDVRPLPPAPQAFSGAVGDFQISSKIVPSQVKAGEPITWTIELAGSGNWPEIRALPAREVSSEFQVIQPKPKRTQPQGKLFEGTLSEDVVLVATHPGTYSIAPLDFTYFDPRSGTYKTITAPGSTVTVEDAAVSGPGPGAVAAAPGVPSINADSNATQAKAPEAPTGGLGDPLPPGAWASRPHGPWRVAFACATPFALPLIVWIVLAYRRARRTDPLLARRTARLAIARTLEFLRSAPSLERPRLLVQWQHDSAILWGIAHAAPPASSITDPDWEALWSEADRCLYGSAALLPSDWVARAQAALEKKALPAFRPASLFAPRNLLPFLALALAAAVPGSLAGADATSSYRSGEFAAAAKAWGEQIERDPLDVAARHNLSLALAQQDRWGEAAAHASAAFVQRACDPAVRRQLAVACDKAGFVPEPVEPLMQAGPLPALARLDSPWGWQRDGLAAAVVAAASLAALIAWAYRHPRPRWIAVTSLVLLVLSILALLACTAAYRAYGIAADTRAVIVWRAGTLRSIPTEADVSQKTTPLPAGSAALADKSFLHWIRLSFPNGETGWVSREEAVFIWGAPPK